MQVMHAGVDERVQMHVYAACALRARLRGNTAFALAEVRYLDAAAL